ncbi:F-box/RNI-like superfamily protein [Striga asiatica]|uniref:F-box/RNI-like superfamily protein n=1 Tax=Striga asiatica TaxID=4170 RepID=A0A5A7R6L3_STRAF|nr:F-box/RNI-like superfamily protein [Striga asiatica]
MASIDRLSALPDDILSHILSFLPLKTSVSTSALSARWRRLWTYAPNIQLTEEYQLLRFIMYSLPESNPYHEKFVDVLTKILSQSESHGVNTLRLDMYYFDEHELEARLESAFACNVKTLDLTLRYGSEDIHLFDEGPLFYLRLNLFDIKMNSGTSKTLVDLRLDLFYIKIKIGTVCLPALKRLHLGGVTLDGTLNNLISCCPVLEEFTVAYYIQCDENMGYHCISSSTMKRLVFNCEFPYKLKIDTPALNYLLLRYDIPHNFSVGSMDFLVEAHIVLEHFKVIVNDNLYSHSLLELLGRFL